MAIIGTGIDLVKISRICQADLRWGDRFRQRILTPDEASYILMHRSPYPHFAGHFAVKEALLKALGTGWTSGMRWSDIETTHKGTGEPRLRLHGIPADLFHKRGGEQIFTSISHDGDYAIAQVILIGNSP